jgi:hypothetical protein
MKIDRNLKPEVVPNAREWHHEEKVILSRNVI